jgi:hypothetical protein
MATADLEALVNAISTARSKHYEPEDRDTEAAKISRLRQLRLARDAARRLWARGRLPPAYGLATVIGLSAALWAIIVGTALFLL